jgi:uncharacterized protein YceH (UPF0502 family)
VHLVVRGGSAEKAGFQEKALAISTSAHGALVILSTNVALGQTLFLKNPRTQGEMEARVVRLKPHQRGRAQVGVEFIEPSSEFWSGKARVARQSGN